MKRSLFILALLLWFSSTVAQEGDTLPVGAVAQRSVTASATVAEFRPIGDARTWIFFARQTVFGQLTSIVKGEKEIRGQNATVLLEALQVDFTKLGQEIKSSVQGESYVTPQGFFAGCDLRLGHPDSLEQLSMSPSEDRLEGFYTRVGTRNDIDLPWKPETFFWDGYLVDQLETYLALRDLQIGTRFDDSVFLPQFLTYVRIKGQVTWFMWQEIYKGKADSVFVIHLTEPGNYQLFFTPDKRLVKVDMRDQQIRVYQDVVRQAPQPSPTAADKPAQSPTPTTQPFSLRALFLKLPHYFAYLVMAVVSLLIFTGRAFKWPASFLSLGAGIVLFVAMPLVVHPLLLMLARDWLKIGSAGAPLLVRGAVFAFVSGLIQAGLMIGGIVGVSRWMHTPGYRMAGVAAFLGAGFALAEAAYLSGFGVELLFDWPLLERGSMIALNIAAAALIGRFLKENITMTGWAALGSGAAIGVARYCPFLVQGKLVDLQLMHFILAFWVAAFVLIVLIMSRKSYGRSNEEKLPKDETGRVTDLQS